MARAARHRDTRSPAPPGWYKDAVIYEVHVRAFRDSDGDGIGDFRGLTEKLDYLVDLGVTALWLLPFFPSPGRDDGYDIADYTSVHPDYGTMADVRTLLAEAHRRGLRVIGELVLNHTSDQHPWFQRARRSPPGSPWREYYVWSDTPDRYGDARIIFTDTETSNWAWDPVAAAYYWHRFFSHQPDLNFENPRVRQEMLAVVDFWLDVGLDGLRLDAVPYLYEEEGTDCENLPATHAFLRGLRAHVDERYGDRLLLAEANQWPEEAVAYFGAGRGDECHMAFHFPLMPRIFMAIRTEDRLPVLDILEQTPAIPETAQWAIFLRNHDELTLEMVTDEERDYLYRAYAADPVARINLGIRRRLAPLAGTRRKLELLFGLLFSLPGTPVLYYGDEIGMGNNYFLGDRNAVRTPMQWSPDRNAGFSEANRQRLYLPLIVDPEYHFEAVNVAVQEGNPSSLLWWMKRVIALRRRHPALARGGFEIVPSPNRHVLAYVREHGDETLLAVANLSRYAQWADLDLAVRAGSRVTELFGGTEFARVGSGPYPLTLGPHAFLWLRLEAPDVEDDGPPLVAPAADGSLAALVEQARHRGDPLAAALARRLALDPAYRDADAVSSSTHVSHVEPLKVADRRVGLLLVAASTRAGEGLTVAVMVELIDSGNVAETAEPGRVIARVRQAGEDGDQLLVDVTADPMLAAALGEIATGQPARQREATLRGRPAARPRRGREERQPVGRDRRPLVRLVGRVEAAPQPEVQTSQALVAAGAPVEPLLGWLEAVVDGTPLVVGYVVTAPDAGEPTFADEAADSLDRLLDAAVAEAAAPGARPLVAASVLGSGSGSDDRLPRELAEIVEAARQVGGSLAGMHDVLARPGGPPLAPYLSMDRRALYQASRTLLGEMVEALRDTERSPDAPALAVLVETVIGARPALDRRLRGIIGRQLDGLRIPRYGGPLTADRVTREGGRYLIGAPAPDLRPTVDRTRLRSPLLDVAGILASLRAVALRPLFGGPNERRALRPEDARSTEGWARAWWAEVGGALVAGYLDALSRPALLPSGQDDRALLLDLLMAELTLEQALADLRVGRPPDPTALVALLDLSRGAEVPAPA